MTTTPRRIMDAAAVAEVRAEMDKAKTSIRTRINHVRHALHFGEIIGNLTECGRAEWLKELDEQTARQKKGRP